MKTNNYQVWEGEMEADGIEDKGVSFFSVIFSATIGILLFIILILKTTIMGIFGIKTTPRLNTRAITVSRRSDEARQMNVSYEYQKQA